MRERCRRAATGAAGADIRDAERALEHTRNLLDDYEDPKVDLAINDALFDYIARCPGYFSEP